MLCHLNFISRGPCRQVKRIGRWRPNLSHQIDRFRLIGGCQTFWSAEFVETFQMPVSLTELVCGGGPCPNSGSLHAFSCSYMCLRFDPIFFNAEKWVSESYFKFKIVMNKNYIYIFIIYYILASCALHVSLYLCTALIMFRLIVHHTINSAIKLLRTTLVV